jgi:hypothetical protein
MKSLIFFLFFAISLTAQTQTFTVAADSTNATFSYNLDAAHSYTFTISGFYKTPWVTIRPAFNPDGLCLADWNGTIVYAPNGTINKNWTQINANQTYFEVPYLMETRKIKLTNVWVAYNATFTISNIQSSGTYPLYLNNNMGNPVALQWKAGTTVTITQN